MTMFRPIDYAPPDLTGPLQLFLAARNASTQRKFAENTEKRQAAQDYREEQRFKAQQEQERHQREIETANMVSPLLAAGRRLGPEAATAMGKPYGISFEQQKPPEMTQLPATPLSAAAARPPKPPEPEMPDLSTLPLPPGVGQALDMAQRGRPQGNDEELLQLAGEAASPTGSLEQALEPPPSKLFASIGGNRFEVPEAPPAQFGPAGQAVYNTLVATGANPMDRKVTEAALKADQEATKESGRNTRAENAITSREGIAETYRPDVETQERFLDKRLAQSEKNARIAGQYKVAAAGPGFKQEAANDRATSLLDRRMENVKRTTQWNKLQQEDRTVRSLMTNIADGTVPLQHRDAQIQLARFFRQAQPTEGEMHLLYNNLGGTMDKWNQFVARMSNGDLSHEQMRQLKASSGQVVREHKEAVRRTYDAVRHSVGPGSGFEQMPDNVNSYVRGMFADIGIDVPDVYGETEGGISLGTGQRPTVRPKAKPKAQGGDGESDADFLKRMGIE